MPSNTILSYRLIQIQFDTVKFDSTFNTVQLYAVHNGNYLSKGSPTDCI